MQGAKFIHLIHLENILSYGPDGCRCDMEPLNVLIGPNASGKSNLIEALSVLAATPKNLQDPILEGGGVGDWLWKGAEKPIRAMIDVTVDYPRGAMPLRYRLAFTATGGRFLLVDEAVENERPIGTNPRPYFYYAYQNGHPTLNVKTESEQNTPRAER